jgi:hypothetical protein
MALPRHRIGPCVFLLIASICCIASVAAGTLSSTVPLSLSPLSLQPRRLLSLRGGSMVKKDATTTAGGAVPPPPTTPTASAGAKTRSKNSFRQAALRAVLGGWGALQVLSILFNAIKRLVPVALEPILKRDLTPPQAVACVVWALFMAYTEGYQAFQRKFSPLVVKRAFGLAKRPTVLRVLLAGPYSMGLFGATQKRMTVSWGVTLGVVAIVQVECVTLGFEERAVILGSSCQKLRVER